MDLAGGRGSADGLLVGLVPGAIVAVAAVVLTGDAATSYDAATSTYTTEVTRWKAVVLILAYLVAAGVALAGVLWLAHREGATGQTPGKNASASACSESPTDSPWASAPTSPAGSATSSTSWSATSASCGRYGTPKAQTFADKIMNTIVVRTM